MKKCPTCSKEFPDSMRFCQSDGTPLLEIVENVAPEDPYKTTVARSEDIASAIPPSDPFKTVVGDAPPSEEADDLLQLPEEHDPLKTSYIPEAQLRQELNLDEPKEEVSETPSEFPPLPSPEDFGEPEQPKMEEPPAPVFNIPEPPKFNEPSLSPPPFGDISSSNAVEEKAPTFDPTPPSVAPDYSEPPTIMSEPPIEMSEPPKSAPVSDSPFGSPFNTPIPSPFDDSKPASYQAPSTPLPSFKEPVANEPVANNPFAPQSSFGQANDPSNQPVKTEWTPPPAPEANWQNQNIGQNTPFQPPPAGAGGQNQTLAIVSLILGIVSIIFCQITGPVALVTGFMARKKAAENPSEFGGAGLALAGIITGAIGTLFLLLIFLYLIFVFVLVGSQAF